MKRLLIIPVLLFTFAANAYDRVPPESIIRHVEPVSQEAVDLVDALNELVRYGEKEQHLSRRNSVRFMLRRDVLVLVPFDKGVISDVRDLVDSRLTRELCDVLWSLTEHRVLKSHILVADQLSNAGVIGIAVEAVNYTCLF